LNAAEAFLMIQKLGIDRFLCSLYDLLWMNLIVEPVFSFREEKFHPEFLFFSTELVAIRYGMIKSSLENSHIKLTRGKADVVASEVQQPFLCDIIAICKNEEFWLVHTGGASPSN
jgi:hypothetical protein